MSTTEPQEEDWDQALTLPTHMVKWGHLVNQLHQDPREDCGRLRLGYGDDEGDADTVGDEDVEEQDEETTASTVHETGVADITWDTEDPYLEFNDENSGTHQTPVAASTPVSIPTEGTLTGPKQPSLKEPQVENSAPDPVAISELVPDYSDIPLVGFSRPELHQVVPWVCFKAESMYEPLWQVELA